MQANDKDQLFRALKTAGNAAPDDAAVRRAVQGLSASERARLEQLLASPERMRALLSSDAAQDLMKQLGKKGP